MFSTTEITSNEIAGDNVIHQRLFYAYVRAAEIISGNVLEIGCGVGRGLSAILDAVEHYTAIDKNEKLTKMLSEKFPQHRFLDQNIPPFTGIADESYDFVISFQVIEHIQDDAAFVREIHRVLKPGGKAVITTPNIVLSLTRNPWHIREYTAEGLKNLMLKYFPTATVEGVTGNQKVWDYYEENKKSVRKYTRLDVFNLQYRLPRAVLQVPYDILNRMNRTALMKKNEGLVSDVSESDYTLTPEAERGFDLFCVAEKAN